MPYVPNQNRRFRPGPQRQQFHPAPAMQYSAYAPSVNYLQTPTVMGTQPPPPELVTHGDVTYTVHDIIQPRTNDPNRMSNGIRVLRRLENGLMVIEKSLMTCFDTQISRVKSEVEALQQVRRAGGCQNVNAIYDVIWDRGNNMCTLILEACNQQTLEQTIIDARGSPKQMIEEYFMWHVFEGMLSALCFIHAGIRNPDAPDYKLPHWNTIVHLDIKPANVFLTSSHYPGFEGPCHRVVLGDFGCSVLLSDIITAKETLGEMPAGTIGWNPPEITQEDGKFKGRYGKPTDIWQTGALIHVMGVLSNEPHQYMMRSQRPAGMKYSVHLSNVVRSALDVEERSRPSAQDLWQELQAKKSELDRLNSALVRAKYKD